MAAHLFFMYGSFIKIRTVSLLWSVLVFPIACWKKNVGFAGLCSLRKIHFSPEDLKFFEIFFRTVNYTQILYPPRCNVQTKFCLHRFGT